MFSDILNEIAAAKKRNSLNEFKSIDVTNTTKINDITDVNSKISNEWKVKFFLKKTNKKLNNNKKILTNKFSKTKKQKIKTNYILNFNLSEFDENIINIINFFLRRNVNQLKVENFVRIRKITGTYDDLYEVIKEFPEFNIFEFFSNNVNIPITEKQKQEVMNFYCLRNNIFLRILIECKINDEDISYLDKSVENFVKINLENSTQIEIDLDFFFLNLLGYKDKSKLLLYKNLDYFKNFVKDYKELDGFNVFNKIAFDKDFCLMNTDDIIIIRQILNNMAKRKFYHGFQLLSINLSFACLMLEGRIWKSIILKFSPEQVFEIWKNYIDTLKPLTYEFYVPTITEAYKNRLKKDNKIEDDIIKIHEKEELDKEINLNPVFDFKDILKIMFSYKNKDTALYFIENHQKIPDFQITPDVFEVCLQNYEDISILVAYKAINNDNAKESYMHTALIKKYFRLAVRLLKLKPCKNFLNSKPPEDDQSFLIMQRMHLKEKMDLYKNLELEKRLNQSKTTEEGNKENLEKLGNFKSELDKNNSHNLEDNRDNKFNDMVKIEYYEDDSKENSISLNSSKISYRKRSFSIDFPLRIKSSFSLYEKNHLHFYISKSFDKKINFAKMKNDFNNQKNKNEKTINLTKSSNNDVYKSINISNADKDSLFHPENTKNKKNVYENRESLNSSKSFKNNPELLILRENEHTDYQNYSSKIEDNGILSEIGLSPKFHKQSVEDEINKNMFMNKISKTLKSGKSLKSVKSNKNSFLNNEDSLKNSYNNILDESRNYDKENNNNQLKNKKSIKKNNEENKFNNDFSINVQSILIDNLSKICKYFLVFTRDEDGISRCRYPILVCVLAAEFLYRLGRLNLKYQYKCHSVAEMMLQLGESLQSAVKDEEMLNYYLRDQTDFKNRSTLEIIAENRFYELLNDENVAAIVSKLWYGTGKNLNLWKFCRITRILSSNIKHEQYDDVINRTKIEMNTKNYSFQYEQYIKNCSVRYMVDSVSTIMTTFLYQIIIYFYVSLSRDGDPNTDNTFRFFNYIANCIVFTINLNLVLYLLYFYKTNRKLKFNFWILLDMIMFLAVLCNFLNLSSFIAGNDMVSKQLIDSSIYSVIIICAWLRVISILMTTRTFGPFLRTIYLLLWTVFNFLLVFFAINTVFAQIFTIIFKKTNSSFRAFFQSWITLFNASFGIYDFTQFTEIKVFGYSLLIAYTTLTNVMLLNLVIAIINNLFNFYEKKADAENRAVLVLTYERNKWDNEYGLLILLPAPFNLFSIFFIIILLTATDRKREQLNSIFSKIAYILVAIANFFMLILWSIFLLPIAYLKSLVHSAYDNHSKFEILKFYRIIYVILTRPFVLIFYIGQDTINFWKICYSKASEEDNEKRMPLVNKEVILNLRKVLFDYKYRYKKKIISLDELYQRLKLNKRKSKENGLISKSSSNGSKLLNIPQTQQAYQINNHPDSNSSNTSLGYLSSNKLNVNLKNLDENNSPSITGDNKDKIDNGLSYRYLVDKIVDKDKYIDIERTLVLLPARVKYSQHFLESLQYMNMRFILRGLRNFFFINAVNNPIYSYKKLQHMIYKILIKFKMIFNYIPDNTMDKIKNDYKEINKNEIFLKSFDNLRKMEEADELSDYDDQGEFTNYVNSSNNNYNQNNNYSINTFDNSDNNLNIHLQKANPGNNTSSNSID